MYAIWLVIHGVHDITNTSPLTGYYLIYRRHYVLDTLTLLHVAYQDCLNSCYTYMLTDDINFLISSTEERYRHKCRSSMKVVLPWNMILSVILGLVIIFGTRTLLRLKHQVSRSIALQYFVVN